MDETSQQRGELFKALSAAQAEMPSIPKDKTAKIPTKSGGQYSYTYADLATIIATVRPCLGKHGLCVSQCINGDKIVTVLGHTSGQRIESVMGIPQWDDIKILGGFITYLRRYALTAILGISAEDDTDGPPEPVAKKQQPRSEKIAPPTPKQQVSTDVAGGDKQFNPNQYPVTSVDSSPWVMSDEERRRLLATGNMSGYTNSSVREVMHTRYGKDATKDLTQEEYADFIGYLGKHKHETLT